MDFLKSFVYSFYNLPEDSFLKLKSIFKTINFKKGDIVLNLNDIQHNGYILKTGIVRVFVLDKQQKQHTKALLYKPYVLSNLDSLINRKPSQQIYECLTDCEMLTCIQVEFEKLIDDDLQIALLLSKILETYYPFQESIIIDSYTLPPYERYKKLLVSFPEINQFIKQSHIASYLNITPVQFSRLKKKHLKSIS